MLRVAAAVCALLGVVLSSNVCCNDFTEIQAALDSINGWMTQPSSASNDCCAGSTEVASLIADIQAQVTPLATQYSQIETTLQNLETSANDLNTQVVSEAEDREEDAIAQSACLAMQPSTGWVFAVPRSCSTQTSMDCTAICAASDDHDPQTTGKTWTCFESLHVYNRDDKVDDYGHKTHKYNSCASTGCGPNFCCCHAA
eukprot:NODE_5338_length_706_cov_107.901554_g5315_i0.p2 GENE.NODE_5338_length_706_cov_107.901554_g5315_i0~~NODE_5338_length_706_cov_107.901554_g5315_i0.p2  ORF type:complete len:200 (+),score=43.76 NODE_5338_length_706_cov_107.901554_g5315_i0:57-656(+)